MSETPREDPYTAAEGEAFEDQDDAGDFASEHEEPTLVDEMPGGPEGSKEDDAPHGVAGAD